MKTREMLQSHPSPRPQQERLAAFIDACAQCAQTCIACADACLAEESAARLARCIRTDLDCADACAAAMWIFSRQTEPDERVLEAQARALGAVCRACAEECAKHESMHEHCRICAESCRRCAGLCDEVAASRA